MPKLEQDRTGEPCPSCHTGRLYPTGKVSREEKVGATSGELGRSQVQYQCNMCSRMTDASGINLGASLSTSVSAKVTNPKDEKK